MIHRRSLLTGFATLLAAPAIVRASSIMPISMAIEDKLTIKCYEHIHPASFGVPQQGWVDTEGRLISGSPDGVWTWEQFLRELDRPDPHPRLTINHLVFHEDQPRWVGWTERSVAQPG